MSENLQYRLYNLSIDPPGNAWPNIALQLDNAAVAEQNLSIKLQQAALEPPPAVWENIVSTLHEKSPARVVPMRRTWTRIAVAAMVAGIIVLAGLFYLMQNESGSTANQNKQQPAPAVTNNQPEKEDINIDVPEPRTTIRYATAGNLIPIRVRKRTSTRLRHARVEVLAGTVQPDLNVDGLVQEPLPKPNAYVPPKDYLTIAAPNGEPAKISAKFSDGLGYLYNYQTVQSIDGALKSLSWKRRFNNWSNKLKANTGFMPSASNFLDIVELQELLKE